MQVNQFFLEGNNIFSKSGFLGSGLSVQQTLFLLKNKNSQTCQWISPSGKLFSVSVFPKNYFHIILNIYRYVFDSSHLYATRDSYTLRLAKASIKDLYHIEEYRKTKKAFRALSSEGVREIECDEKLPPSIVHLINNLIFDCKKPVAFLLEGRVKTLVYSQKDEKFYIKSVDDSVIQLCRQDSKWSSSLYLSLISSIQDVTVPVFSDSTDINGFSCCVRCLVDNGRCYMTPLRVLITPYNSSIQGSFFQQYFVQNLLCHINLKEKKVVFIREENDPYISPNSIPHAYIYEIDYTNLSQDIKDHYKEEISSLIQQAVKTQKTAQLFLKTGMFLRCTVRMETILLSLDHPKISFLLKIPAFSSGIAAMKRNNNFLQSPKVGEDLTSFITQEMRVDLIADANKAAFASKIISIAHGYILAFCQKTTRGSFIIIVQNIQFSFAEKERVLSLLDILTSAKNTFFRDLYYETLKKAKVSTFLQYKGVLYTFTLFMVSETHFRVSCSTFEITTEQLLFAKVALPITVREAINPLLPKLYAQAMSFANKKEVGVYISTEKEFLYTQLHVKKNSTIVLGIETYFDGEVFNKVQKMIKITIPFVAIPFKGSEKKEKFDFGSSVKRYGEVISERKDLSFLKQQELVMKKFASPYTLRAEKIFVKNIIPNIWNRRVGIKMDLYDFDSAETFVQYHPATKKELLGRLLVGYDAAKGLSFIHEYSSDLDSTTRKPIRYAHMNFKPENLYISRKNGILVGIVGNVNPMPEGVKVFSTSLYTSPEISFDGGCSSQANDVWSLGITFFELIYGRGANPFSSQENFPFFTKYQILMKFLEEQMPYNPINSVIAMMLSHQALKRPRLKTVLPLIERAIAAT